MVIVAVKDNPTYLQMGLHFFDEQDWPQPGYTLVKKVITDQSAAQLRAARSDAAKRAIVVHVGLEPTHVELKPTREREK